MHPEKLDVESVQVRNMRNEVHEVRKLENVSIQLLKITGNEGILP